MFPLRDSTPRKNFPFINYLIIGLIVFIFLVQISVPDFESFVRTYAFIPKGFHFLDLSSYRHILYSIFLHGGWFHLLSNVWFLHIFGDNVEDRLGHFKYLVFYLAAGTVSVFSQYFMSYQSSIPMLGASGAISGVAGAYFVFFKRSKIEAIVPSFFGFWDIIELPTWFFLGYWFVIQVFSGVGSLVTFDVAYGGVAYFAHIGGFAFGYFVAEKFRKL